ncbi:MAG: tRNA(Ile)-lysidine synthase [Nitrospinaceae bacterium]|nr:MAG: tRNA(Ile)-lysidine synthase [Nitrospinaceae bacterium]
MKNFLEKSTLALSRMVSSGDKIVVAVSGGPDSVALLHLLNETRREFDVSLTVAHLDHMARGKESEEDARFVEELGEKLGLETFIERVDIRTEKEKLKTSFQESARILRYRFLLSIMKRCNANRLALGHNADDQVETVLLNLLRGSGLKGLAGMPEKRGEIIRPLIDCTRTEIEAYLDARSIESRTDSTNASHKYVRNRIRRELLPVLKTFNENITANLLETAKIIRDDDGCLQGQVRQLYPQIAMPINANQGVVLDREKFNEQAPALQKRLVRQAIATVQGNLRRISTKHIQQVLELFCDSSADKKIDLPGPLLVVSRLNGVEFQKSASYERSRAVAVVENDLPATELQIPGATEIHKAGIRLQARILTPESRVKDFDKGPRRAFFDYDKTGTGIKARFFKPGDRFIPLGMKGRKKLKSFFIDEKIPKKSRESIPILTTAEDDIIWVYGGRISDEFRVTEETRAVLCIEGDGDFQTFPH